MSSLRATTILIAVIFFFKAQGQGIDWADDGNAYYQIERNNIVQYNLPEGKAVVLVSSNELNAAGISIEAFYFSKDHSKLLIYTNAKRVWRLATKGDYWLFDMKSKQLRKLGDGLQPSSMMFAKISPDATQVAYVSGNNLWVEEAAGGKPRALTTDGSRKLINGTFDWVYEEEFACRDGFQWSPDGKHIAFWQIDANRIRDFNMINNTDSVYSQIIPVEYPTAGEDPSPARIGIISLAGEKNRWLDIPGDPTQHYIPRIEWRDASTIYLQQLNRKQNASIIYSSDINGKSKAIYREQDEAWVDMHADGPQVYALDFRHRFVWLNGGREFLWISEKDGWRHAYRINEQGRETLLTKGDYDLIELISLDEKSNVMYFTASPTNATQKYLYKAKLDGKGKPERVTPEGSAGTHTYQISPGGRFAIHQFTNINTRPSGELISLPDHKPLNASQAAGKTSSPTDAGRLEFFKIKTVDGVEMDGWVAKPKNFDPNKKYPVVFFVYAEPAGANVIDRYSAGRNHLYDGDMAEDGYLYVSIDNRGTPAPKGRTWRKAIYKKIGQINIRDQAMAAQEVLKWNFVDRDRVAVWGWSGGGSTTLNLMFQYPEIYKTGIAVAAVTNLRTYDNIYEERYMGLPQENADEYFAGSPLSHVRNLKGKLLYIHGTGDDNVHYSNAEMLLNELVKYNKQFEFMAYPNRTHGISEGEGTTQHLMSLYTRFLKDNCPPGGR